MQHVLVYITAPTPEVARNISDTVVRERLAACANIIESVSSLYWWDGAVQHATESICLLKTTDAGFSALEARVRSLHPYEIPCIVALPLTAGSAPFLQWITRETSPASP